MIHLFYLSTCLWPVWPCSCPCIPNRWLTPCTTWATKCDPLSELISLGTPNRGIISCTKALTTSLALFVLQGKASGHPEKVSVRTRSHLCPPFLGNSEKSICHTSPGTDPLGIAPVFSLRVALGLFLRQISQVEVTSSIVSFSSDAITLSFKRLCKASAPQCVLECSLWINNFNSFLVMTMRSFMLAHPSDPICPFSSCIHFKSSVSYGGVFFHP